MGHYDSCYEADAQDNAKKRHKEIKKELKDLINKLDDDERELLIVIIKNFEDVQRTLSLLNRMVLGKK
jgi:hypothetical protein